MSGPSTIESTGLYRCVSGNKGEESDKVLAGSIQAVGTESELRPSRPGDRARPPGAQGPVEASAGSKDSRVTQRFRAQLSDLWPVASARNFPPSHPEPQFPHLQTEGQRVIVKNKQMTYI